MSARVLLAEDEPHKSEKVMELLSIALPECQVTVARSVKSALRNIQVGSFELLLLDMSLPTFDVGPGESGGRPQGFGGMEVMRYLKHHEVRVPVIIVTQYEAFSDSSGVVDLGEMASRLRSDHPENFVACVHFAPMSEAWKPVLSEAITSCGLDGKVP
jgi:CheY-like chemotaxis protein